MTTRVKRSASIALAAIALAGATGAADAQTTSACGRRTDCAEVGTFVASVTDFRVSQGGGVKVITTIVRFKNKTNRPLTLGYVMNTGIVTDDQGNRYVAHGVEAARGIGAIAGPNFDSKFTLQPGEWSDARIEYMLRMYGNTILGTRYDVELTVREIDPLPGNQWRLGREHALQFRGFPQTTVASADAPVQTTSAGTTEKPSPSTADAPAAVPDEVDYCAGKARCYPAGPFVAEVTQLAFSGTGRGHRFMKVTVKFRNITTKPIILGYRASTSLAVDDLGNRYYWGRAGTHDGSVQGMGYVTGRGADPQFVLAPGQSRSAVFNLFWPNGASGNHGSTYTHDLTVVELQVLPSRQVRVERDYAVSFASMSPGASPQAATNDAAAALVEALRKKLQKP